MAHSGKVEQYSLSSEQSQLEDILIQWEGPASRRGKRYQADKNIRCLQHTISVEDGKNFEGHSKKNKDENKRAHSENSKNKRLSVRKILTPNDQVWTSGSH